VALDCDSGPFPSLGVLEAPWAHRRWCQARPVLRPILTSSPIRFDAMRAETDERDELGVWASSWLDTTPELTVRADPLTAGGPPLWERFRSQLRAGHLEGAPTPADGVLAELGAACEAGAKRGHEAAEQPAHRRFTEATGIQVYFCDPKSLWQRGATTTRTRTPTNGCRLRQYLSQRLDFRTLTELTSTPSHSNSTKETSTSTSTSPRLQDTITSTNQKWCDDRLNSQASADVRLGDARARA